MMSMQPTEQRAVRTADSTSRRSAGPETAAPRRRILAIGAATAALLALASTRTAVLASGADEQDDHDEARRALLAGEVRPLRQVLDEVARDFPGEPVKIEFERDDGVYVYEIKLLQPSGTIVKLKIDARTGAVLKLKGRNIERRTN